MPPKNYYNLPTSWNPGYEVPVYVMDEPVARGAHVTQQLPRGTISHVEGDFRRVPGKGSTIGNGKGLGSLGGSSLSGPTLGPSTGSGGVRPMDFKGPRRHQGIPWDPGFAVPNYARAETYGQGAYGTNWLPRGTISQRIAEFGQPNAGTTILDRNDAGLGSLGDDTLGVGVGKSKNPVAEYGNSAASWIMHSIQRVPLDQREAAMRGLLDAVEHGLWSKIQGKREELKRKGMDPKAALSQAIALMMSSGIQKEIIDTGKKAMRTGKRAAPKPNGHLALGAYPDAAPKAIRYALEPLGFGFSDLNPVNLVTKGLSAINSVTSVVTRPVGTAVNATGSAIKTATLATGGFIKDGVSTLASLACKVIGSDVYKTAQQGIATGFGGPQAGQAASVGVDIQRTVCGNNNPPPPSGVITTGAPVSSGLPAWVLPAALGVGLFGAGALLLKKRK
jgi:hypothetical protein